MDAVKSFNGLSDSRDRYIFSNFQTGIFYAGCKSQNPTSRFGSFFKARLTTVFILINRDVQRLNVIGIYSDLSKDALERAYVSFLHHKCCSIFDCASYDNGCVVSDISEHCSPQSTFSIDVL